MSNERGKGMALTVSALREMLEDYEDDLPVTMWLDVDTPKERLIGIEAVDGRTVLGEAIVAVSGTEDWEPEDG